MIWIIETDSPGAYIAYPIELSKGLSPQSIKTYEEKYVNILKERINYLEKENNKLIQYEALYKSIKKTVDGFMSVSGFSFDETSNVDIAYSKALKEILSIRSKMEMTTICLEKATESLLLIARRPFKSFLRPTEDVKNKTKTALLCIKEIRIIRKEYDQKG